MHSAQIGFRVFDENGALESAAYMSSRQIEFGVPGVEDRMYIGVDRNNGKPYISLPGIGMLHIDWRDNGDGTYTLIGQ